MALIEIVGDEAFSQAILGRCACSAASGSIQGNWMRIARFALRRI